MPAPGADTFQNVGGGLDSFLFTGGTVDGHRVAMEEAAESRNTTEG